MWWNRVCIVTKYMIETDRRNATELPERSIHVISEIQCQQNQDIEEPMIFG